LNRVSERYGLQLRPLGGDTPLVLRVLAAQDLIDEAPIGLEVDEVRNCRDEQRIADCALQVPMRALD